MKTLLRTLLALALIVWLGAEIFFPIVAAITFNTLRPDTHTAGTIVGQLIRILHGMGLVSGMVALAVMALAPAWGIFKPRAVLAPMVLVVLMMASTVYSQFGIIPAMERDRIAAGGTIDTTDTANPTTAHFNKLHKRSEFVEEAILLLGLATVVLVARAETGKTGSRE
jgi:ABC-type siderophore export system fused ATPase/permease subunit